MEPAAIDNAVKRRRLHPLGAGVYAVGRSDLTQEGRLLAAVLKCGDGALLSGLSAAFYWMLDVRIPTRIEVAVPASRHPRVRGITIHRRSNLRPADATRHRGIPVTSVVCTLVDIAPRLGRDRLEAVVSKADLDGLVALPRLRSELEEMAGRPGVAILRSAIDDRSLRRTRSWLERRFLRLVAGAGLPLPESNVVVNGYEVDFHWPEAGLVVETDGLRYHRTPTQQQRDRLRDQAQTAAGLTTLRFTSGQIERDPDGVIATLIRVYRRLI